MTEEEPSYIDYDAFLSPTFSPHQFANTLILSTNNPSDTPLDLSTPLSRVLFDVQEIDTHIDTLTTKAALPLLSYTRDNVEASGRILEEVEKGVKGLTEGYARLEKEILERYQRAMETKVAAERLWSTVRLGRSVQRCLTLGKQLEVQMGELQSSGTTTTTNTTMGAATTAAAAGKGEDHRSMVRASTTLLLLRELFIANKAGEEGEGLDRVNVVQTLKADLAEPAERKLVTRAQQIIREFSTSPSPNTAAPTTSTSNSSTFSPPQTFSQSAETKARTTSALQTLYLLSPSPRGTTPSTFSPSLMLTALQAYLQTAHSSSLASLSRALANPPLLEKTLLEVSARCSNIVALSSLLASSKPSPHPLLLPSTQSPTENLLHPLLQSLDTTSLPSHFWRTLSSALSVRVQEMVSRGGPALRTLRTQRERLREGVRECVLNGVKDDRGRAGWDREVAVMLGAVTNLGR
ncbi:MAG: hypothetical protein M1824_000157 [Vezdaea acicularis]|nr:MAG: hypothetical protein M1824_000157 [Vezdaea acicularis]